MSVRALDFLLFAEECAKKSDEMHKRMATGRAYYAAYHMARETSDACPANDHFIIVGGTHAKLADKFKSYKSGAKELDNKSSSIAYVLIAMKRSRVMADYQLEQEWPGNVCDTQLRQAQRFQAILDEWAALVASHHK